MIRITLGMGSDEFPDMTIAEAIIEAKQRLRDDPELGHVDVFADERYIGCATSVPDSDWQSVVAWLWEGEKVQPPSAIPPIHSEDGYEITDPKHPRHHEVMSDLYDRGF
jgi:hypothetical protein